MQFQQLPFPHTTHNTYNGNRFSLTLDPGTVFPTHSQHSTSLDDFSCIAVGAYSAAMESPSPRKMSMEPDALPNNVQTHASLADLPSVCLSGDEKRPLKHVGESGEISTYSLHPMTFSVVFILIVELFERFSFYGIEYTQTSFLTGVYDEDWNAGMTSIKAASYVSIATAVAYSAPFLGAYMADSVFGDYYSILLGCLVFYLPGMLLITLTTVPYLLGDEFSELSLVSGLLVLWPCGTGIVKAIVSVFGAKQFHPLLQSSLIESYYVSFYMIVNIGALAGGFTAPILAQRNVTLAYGLCSCMLGLSTLVFLLGTRRYVRGSPSGVLTSSKAKRRGDTQSKVGGMFTIFRITILILPFAVTYSQMATTFIVQGTVMEKAFGFMDAASMNNIDAISVLVFGYLIGAKLYPLLASRGWRLPTTYKFAIGSAFGAAAVAWAIFVDYKIHDEYNRSGSRISVMWQAGSYMLIGAGEIFSISTAYEAAFSAAPPERKVLASAVNLFSYGGIPNVLCIGLYNICAPWFRNSHGTTALTKPEDYASAHVGRYFVVLFCISLLGVVINVLPSVRDFVADAEKEAADAFRTPMSVKRRQPGPSRDEESPLLRMERHRAYLKYGSGPKLYKSGSIHVDPYKVKPKDSDRHIRESLITRLYQSKSKRHTTNERASTQKEYQDDSLLAPTARRQDTL